MEQIMSLEFLATNVGAIAFVTLVVQYTKPFIPLTFSTRLYVLLLSMVVMFGSTALLSPSLEGFILAFVNGFVVAAGCLGTYDVTFKPVDMAKRGEV